MKSFKTFAAASCLGLMTLVPSAMADQWNKKTYITINEAVQVPGKVLQPGRYVMRLLDSPSNRHIVQIFNEREDQLQTTVLAIPNYRLQPTGQTEFQWWETPAGQPKALRAWFYPGDNFGQEFAYPKSEAMRIASTSNTNVPTTYAETETELATARVGTIDSAGTELELDRQTYSRSESNQNMEVAQNRQTMSGQGQMEQSQATTGDMQRQTQSGAMTDSGAMANDNSGMETGRRARTLPRTASPVPMFGMAGFLALGAGMALRALGNRS